MTDDKFTRRTYVKAGVTAGIAGLAGCTGSDGQDETTTTESEPTETETETETESGGDQQEQDGQELEIVHWWTAGGEQDALNALLEGFQKEHPEVGINNNPAPGGAGSALDAVIRNRVVNENPPSTFQIWPGKALAPYVENDVLVNIGDSVWDDEMRNAYLDGVKEAAAPQGDFVSVPINIHRLNNLFYNVEVLESAGVDPASIDGPDALVDAMQTVQDQTDAVGMAHQTQSPWSTVQLWETVFIGQHGVEEFRRFLDGNAADQEEQIKSSLQTVADYREFFPEDAGSVSWDQGNSKVINGEAAFIHQGDWAAGQYEAQEDFEYENGWDYVPFPGTDGVYSLVMDSFVFPDNNPSPQATEKFLNYCGTVDAQERFNPIKGSIPPRTDVSDDAFGPFLTQQKKDFSDSDAQVPTVAHGTGVVPDVKTQIEETFSGFIEQWDVDSAHNGIVNAFE